MAGSATTVRIPTSRLRPAVEAAMAAYREERWAKIDAAIDAEMSRPEPAGWWSKRFDKRPAATREEALAAVPVVGMVTRVSAPVMDWIVPSSMKARE